MIDPIEDCCASAPSHVASHSNTVNRVHYRGSFQVFKYSLWELAPGVTLDTLKSWLATLASFKSEAPIPLLEAKNMPVGEFFHRLKDYCNAQDPDILEDLIEALGDDKTKTKLSQFTMELSISI